ncbi:MAG: ABC transporter ATP-binding protein [Sphaerimonospora mesophila]
MVNKKNTIARRTLHYYWQETKRQWRYLLPILIVMPAAVFLNTYATAWIMSDVINRLTENPPAADQVLAVFGPHLALYAGAMIIGELVCWRLVLFLCWKGEVRGMYSLRKQCFDHLSDQSMHFHNNKFGGSLVTQVSRFVGAYERISDTVIWNIIPFVSSLTFALLILGFKLPLFALVLGVLSAIFIAVAWLSFKKIRVLNEREAAAGSKLTGQLADSITNISTVKSFSQEKHEIALYAKRSRALQTASMDLMRSILLRDFGFGAILVILAIVMFVFLIGGNAWLGVPIGTLFLAVSYTSSIWGQLWQFNRILRDVNRSFGDAHEMTEILDEAVVVKDKADAYDLAVGAGAVEFRDVTFWHRDAKESDKTFENLTLVIPSGQRVGLVGHSGSGKTTLTKLLLRFADVQHGAILIDGQNISDITQSSLRGAIAYVPQEPMLFHRSIRENIAYGRPNATDSEIREAAAKANALEFIEALPEGFDTLTGERGVKLSGGQRQRIAIARAILKDAPILVLDEATSALDTESERLIQEALKHLMAGRTTIVIAHRLSTVAGLDRIIVLENGEIAEDDTHANLIRRNGKYAKLWNRQTNLLEEEEE